jgi:hypothetical protein
MHVYEWWAQRMPGRKRKRRRVASLSRCAEVGSGPGIRSKQQTFLHCLSINAKGHTKQTKFCSGLKQVKFSFLRPLAKISRKATFGRPALVFGFFL